MVAVVSGSGLGLFGSSASVLGGVGATGSAGLGRGTDRVFVNSATGNLVVQSQDERLSALGLDLSLIRTYNSQGLMDDDNGDNWRLGVYQRVHGLSGGALNTAGSTIRKVFGDGREVLYTYDVAQSRYVSTEGDGAHDTLTNSGGTWTWTDGSGRNTETYNSNGQLTHSRDADGNALAYGYSGNLLTQVTDASGQTTYLDYTGNNLAAVRVVSNGQTQTLTRYFYDSANRLRQVVLDLSPADNAVSLVDANGDGLYESVNDQTYVTTYTYDGTSRRIASIAQADGSSVSFTYQQIDGQYRVRTYTDAENRTTTLTYSQPTGGSGSTQAPANPAALSTTRTENHDLNSGALTVSAGAGTWSAAQLFETSNGANASVPSMAFDAAGNGFAVWVFNGDIFARRYDAASAQWSAQVRVDSTTDWSGGVQIAIDRVTGKAVLGWMQTSGVAVSSYDLATGTWGAVQLVAATSAISFSRDAFAISIAGDFTAITWLHSQAGRWNVQASVSNNGVWGTTTLLENATPHASVPQIGIDANGNALVSWSQSDGTLERLYYSRWDHASQSFSGPTLLDNGTGATERPRLSFDGNGNAMAVWAESGALYARRFNATTASWDSAVPVQTGAFSTWDLSVDAHGNALIGWVQADGATTSAYARRFDAVSGTWGTVALLESSTSAVSATRISVAIAGQNAVVGWLQTNGTSDDLYAVTLNAGTWSTPQLLDSRTSAVTSQFAAVDMGGSATLVWEQVDANNFRSIYQARYTSPGYYIVPSGATWQSIANTLYGVNSAAAGSALQAMMGNPTLIAGASLSGWPATLGFTATVPGYYTVQSGDTWASITQAIYGTSAAAAVSALQAQLGSPTLAPGLELDVPATLSYGGTGTTGYLQTDVQDALGLVTRYTQDAAGRLSSVLSPTVDGSRMETRYGYDSQGNLASITEDPTGLNRVTTFGYDARGNLILTRDSLGNTVTRTYDSNNQLLTQTEYVGRDPDGAGSAQPTEPKTTRYVYDAESHLRFVISPEGRVTEHRYDASGQRTSSRTYLEIHYTGTNFAESDLVTWSGSGDRTIEFALYAYDFRGNVSNITQYWGTTIAGGPLGTPMITRFVYDQRGQLLQRIDPRGEATTGNPNDHRTAYTYDGLGRLLTTNEWISATTTRTTLNAYDDAGRVTRSTFANGLVTTSTYNRAGELMSVANGSAAAPEALGKTTYVYDSGGRLRMRTDPAGVREFFFYDEAGRQVAYVDGDGSLTQYVYNRAGQLIKTIEYAALVPPATVVDGSGNPRDVALSTLRTAAGGNPDDDRITRNVYDASGALVYTIDPFGALVGNSYDGAGRLIQTLQYANRFIIDRSVDEVLPSAVTVATHDDDRRTRYFFDGDGLRIGMLDAEGYLTAYGYSGAGRLLDETRYANRAAAAVRATGTLTALKNSVLTDTESAIDPERDQVTDYFYDSMGRLTGVLDAEGYLTETQYDSDSNVFRRIRYDQVLPYRSSVSALRGLVSSTTVRETTEYTYDGEGKVLTEVFSRGTATPVASVTTTYSYDLMGNLISTTRAAGTSEARTTQARYDFLGRVAQELSGEGSLRITAGMTAADIENIWTRWGVTYAYDTAGRRISATRSPHDTQSGTPQLEVARYYYDQDGRVRFEINHLGERKEYRYNALGQLSEEVGYSNALTPEQMVGLAGGALTESLRLTLIVNTSARDSLTSYRYSLTGKVSSLRRAVTELTDEDQLTTYTYNAFGELALKLEAIDSTRTLRTDYTYDKRGQLTLTRWDDVVGGFNISESRTYDSFGRLRTVTDARLNVVSSYEYDRLGRQTASVDANTTDRTVTRYDGFGRVMEVRDPFDNVTSYSYDETFRRMTVTTPQNIAVVTEYNAHGQVFTVTAAGRTTQYTYNRDGQLTNVSDNGGPIESRSYDRSGRQITTTDALNVVTRFEYDAADRVLKRIQDNAGLQLTTSYTYDGMGRVTRVVEPSGRRTDTTHYRDGSIEQTVVDPNGFQIRTRYVYDRQGRALRVTEGADSDSPRLTEYRYDVLGRRTLEIVDPGTGNHPTTGRPYLNITTEYRYDDNGNLTRKIDGEGHSTWYVYDTDNRVTHTIDALGGVTLTKYDHADRVIETRRIATRLSDETMNALAHADEVTLAHISVAESSADRTSQTVYDRDGRGRFAIDAMGGVTERTFDANGNVTRERAYAARIAVASYTSIDAVEGAIGANALANIQAEDHVQWTAYDLRGQATFKVDGLGGVVRFSYDANGNITSRIAYATAIGSGGSMSATDLGNWADQAAIANDANNRVTRYCDQHRRQHVHDRSGRLGRSGRDCEPCEQSRHALLVRLDRSRAFHAGCRRLSHRAAL